MSLAESSSVKKEQPAPTPAPQPRSGLRDKAGFWAEKFTTRYVVLTLLRLVEGLMDDHGRL